MKKFDDRRSFLKKIAAGGVGAAIAPVAVAEADEKNQHSESPQERIRSEKATRNYNGPYTGDHLKRIAFPIGGLGAGMFCLEGTGAFSHMSVRHKPEIFHEPGMFAAISVKGITSGAKVLEGPSPDWKKFGQRDAGNGLGGTIYGLPHFRQATFITRFPFASIDLQDEDVPLKVHIEGWSPFVPTDADSSSLPVGALEYQFQNTGSTTVDAIFSFNAKNFLRHSEDREVNSIKKIANGFILASKAIADKKHPQADFAIFTDQPDTIVDHCWFRGGWFDPLTITWETIRAGNTKKNEPVEHGAPGASLFVPFKLATGESKTIRLMTVWYVPESDIRVGEDAKADDTCGTEAGCCATSEELGATIADEKYTSGNFKPWYTSKFSDITAVVAFFQKNYDDLRNRSKIFSDSFYSSTLPAEVIEAVAANLTILKSPTVMRQYDGRLWSFEGCGDNWGCCHGTCTHVWNYAQAIPHLFPALERTLRHTEFCESQNADGHQNFRASLPIRPLTHNFYAAADGQLGGIMKVHREWRISGDNQWLGKMYPLVKKSMDYCIRTWDPKNKGIVEEPHHNTYDIEFWGPDGMCTSFYLGALTAMMEMGKFLKKDKDVKVYKDLYTKGKQFLETELFDGEYFFQKIQVEGLNAPNPLQASEKSMGGEYSQEARALLEKEGPKYQYGKGCLSDGILGVWIARMSGLPDPVDAEKTRSHLMAVHKYNLKKNLSDHANPQRPSFAFGEEGGLLLCSWPKGGKLSLPFVYSDEVWTGIEYQVASHLMLMGKVNEALEIVQTCRDRYDGRVRNPFNEYECGHWYARALSCYGFLQGLTGVRFDAVDKTLYIDSKIGDFTSFLSTATGFGNISLRNGKPSLSVAYGKIPVEKINLSGKVIPYKQG